MLFLFSNRARLLKFEGKKRSSFFIKPKLNQLDQNPFWLIFYQNGFFIFTEKWGGIFDQILIWKQHLGITEPLLIKHVLFHPSQNVTPSQEDIEVTRRLVEAGKILGIVVLDHLIVNADAEFYSLKEKGRM